MAGVRMEITTNRIADVLSLVRSQPSRLVREAAGIAETTAKEHVAVDTGNLRGSIRTTVRNDSAEVWTDVEYAEEQEYGTAKQSGTPYMRPGAAAAQRFLREQGLRRAAAELEGRG